MKKEEYTTPKLTVVGTAADVTGPEGKQYQSSDTHWGQSQAQTYYQYNS